MGNRLAMKDSDCQIKRRGECCCICRYHLRDIHHPSTDVPRELWFEHKGWVCAAFLIDRERPSVCSGWTNHGLCELFQVNKKT